MPKSPLDGPLLRFRVMAFVTGVVLLAGTIALIAKYGFDAPHMKVLTGVLWTAHGYLYLLYVITVLILGLKARWHVARVLLVMAAGTIPTMSFVAEHVITRYVRAQQSGTAPATGSPASETAR